MLLIQLESGKTDKLDPRIESDLIQLDSSSYQKQIRRVSIIDSKTKRVDLPLNKNGRFFMWCETINKSGEIRGECFCMRTNHILIKATLYYSDSRVVVDIDHEGGFNG
jgi:hypothetical protein